MPAFTVSLIASISVSAQVVIEADNETQAIDTAKQLQTQGRLGWTYNGLPIPSYNGPVASVWADSQGNAFAVSLIASIPVSAQVVIEADHEAEAIAIANQLHAQARIGWTYNGRPIPSFNGPVASVWTNPEGVVQNPRISTVTLVCNPTQAVFGTTVTATATIAPGAIGEVDFFDGTVLIGTTIPNAFGVATLSNVSLPVGLQSIFAKFAGDAQYDPNVSNTVKVLITSPATTTTIDATPNPQNFGQDVVVTSSVSSLVGTPSGLVIFYDGGVQFDAAALNGGSCSVSVNSLAAGVHKLTAGYQGSSSYAPSTSGQFTETILATSTITTVVSNLPTAAFDESVTFTATVTATVGIPNVGTVHFIAIPTFGPNVDMGLSLVDGTGHASISFSTLPVASYTIQAAYSGGVQFAPSSGTTLQVVGADPTTTSVVSSNPAANFGDNIQFTATVMSTFGLVNVGTVSITALSDGPPISIGSGDVDGSGQLILNTSTLPAGAYTIQASYAGTTDFGPSSGTTGQTVSHNIPTVPINVSPDDFNDLYSGHVTYSVDMSGNIPLPTGTVTFYQGLASGWPGSASPVPGGSNVPLVSGIATISVLGSSIADGVYIVSASYGGDSNYVPVAYTDSGETALTVRAPFTKISSSHASTSGSTLTDTSVNFLPGGVFSVVANDQVIMLATGHAYRITSVSATSIDVQSVGVNGNDGNPFDPSDIGSGLSYIIQTSNIDVPYFFADASTSAWSVYLIPSGDSSVPDPTGTVTFFSNNSGTWSQLGLINLVDSNSGSIRITTSTNHGLVTGQQVVISGVVGVPANGTWTVTVLTVAQFVLNGSVFSGSYVSGGATSIIISGGVATYTMTHNFIPWSGGLNMLSVQYNGDSNYNATPNINGDTSLPAGAPLLGAVHARSL